MKQEPRGSKDATTLSSLIVHFFLFFFDVIFEFLVHVKFRRNRNIGKDVFRRSKITRDRRTDGRTDTTSYRDA